jgi:hypothetical protein
VTGDAAHEVKKSSIKNRKSRQMHNNVLHFKTDRVYNSIYSYVAKQ